MSLTTTDRLHQISLAVLEVIVLTLYLLFCFVDLSFLDLWMYWLAMVFFWLIILLLLSSVRMFSKHRRLAVVGLGLVALIVVQILFSGLFSMRR
jgi:asparagine N-glycosylation enzyme membrane subunit Stt3